MDMNYIEYIFLISVGKKKQKKPYQLENLKTKLELQTYTF